MDEEGMIREIQIFGSLLTMTLDLTLTLNQV